MPGWERFVRRVLDSEKVEVLDRDALVPVRTPGVEVLPVYEWLLAERGRT